MNDLRRLVVVSPHLDDAVLSCGNLLAAHPGATVITALAGRPPAYGPLTEWDAASGFRAGDDVVSARREEDRRGLAVLGATPVWLDFCDAQYGSPPSVDELAHALAVAIAEAGASTVVVPLGLFHSDHALTHDAILRLVPGHALDWLAYEEASYRRVTGLLAERLEALEALGFRPKRVDLAPGVASPLKRRALARYRSQLRALATDGRPGHRDALEEEGYWRLTP